MRLGKKSIFLSHFSEENERMKKKESHPEREKPAAATLKNKTWDTSDGHKSTSRLILTGKNVYRRSRESRFSWEKKIIFLILKIQLSERLLEDQKKKKKKLETFWLGDCERRESDDTECCWIFRCFIFFWLSKKWILQRQELFNNKSVWNTVKIIFKNYFLCCEKNS